MSDRQTDRPTDRQTDRPTDRQTGRQILKSRDYNFTPTRGNRSPTLSNRLTDRRTSLEKILSDRREKLDRLTQELSDLDRSSASRRPSIESRSRFSDSTVRPRERRDSLDRRFFPEKKSPSNRSSFRSDRSPSCVTDSYLRRSNQSLSSERSPLEKSNYRRPILETCGTLPEPPPRRASLEQTKRRSSKRRSSMDQSLSSLDQLQEDSCKVKPKPKPQSTNTRTDRPTDKGYSTSPHNSSRRSSASDQSSMLRRENSLRLAREIIQKYR